MNYWRSLLVIVLFCSSAAAQDKKLTQAEIDKATEEGLKNIQGLWMFEKAENNGGGRFVLPQEGIFFEKSLLRQTKKNGELIFNGTALEFTIDPTKNPMTIDLVRKNGSPGQKIFGIYKIEDGKLILATDTTDSGKRPSKFSVKLTAGPERATNLQTYKLEKAEAVEKPAAKKKLSEKELDTANESALKSLQGQWVFEKSVRNGFSYWVLPEESFYIEKNLLRMCKKNGDLVFNGDTCELKIDASEPHLAVDLIRKNGAPGAKVFGIFKVDGDRLTIATNTADNADIRPGQFTVKLTAGLERASIVQTYKRVKAEEAEKPAAKKKLTQEQLDAANAEALKSLQGQWVFEKSERNGFSYWVLPEDSFYIEKNLLRRCKKNGDLIFNGDTCEFKVDASQPNVGIDLVRKNGAPGAKVFGIFKVEGDRLTIATNTADHTDTRPGQFTVRLTAGPERASIVQTYKRAAAKK